MVNTPDISNKMLDIEQHRVETFQCSSPRISGKFCMLFNIQKNSPCFLAGLQANFHSFSFDLE